MKITPTLPGQDGQPEQPFHDVAKHCQVNRNALADQVSVINGIINLTSLTVSDVLT